MARFAFRQAALSPANSGDLRDAVVPLGAALEKFDMHRLRYGFGPATSPDQEELADLRASFGGAAANQIVVLAVGRMVPKKGFDILLRAMAEPPAPRTAHSSSVLLCRRIR